LEIGGVMGYFKVIKQIGINEVPTSINKTKHLDERIKRFQAYKKLLSNHFKYAFLVDTNHANGLEIHSINENGLVYVFNNASKKLVTIIHPRPRQLKRYFHETLVLVPEDIKKMCEENYKRNEEHVLNYK
jgi:hypothetical protein